MERVSLFGIRHHGPGCARALHAALAAMAPDLVLLEGPQEAEHLLPFVAEAEMRPPVAILVYARDEPGRACMYPFAEFSPEWQALHYAATHAVPLRFMDLPIRHRFALDAAAETAPPEQETPEQETPEQETPEQETPVLEADERSVDPLGWLAQAAGFDDGESWWEYMVEGRHDQTDLFPAIAQAMTELRADREIPLPPREALREAAMRKCLREALKDNFQRIAVICGAWHLPALRDLRGATADNALLKGLPSMAVQATWIPWSYQRLASSSGYGAGVPAPGWYDHLYRSHGLDSGLQQAGWLARVGQRLRQADVFCSAAHLIDALRTAEALAALRQRPRPSREELEEALVATVCMGEPHLLELVRRPLLLDDRLGQIPNSVPQPPLALDLAALAKRLRLSMDALVKPLELDLRKANDLARSCLLHRLALLDLNWGKLTTPAARSRGSFREAWQLRWQPEFAARLIELAVWGGTVEEATRHYLAKRLTEAQTLEELTALLRALLLADLGEELPALLARIESAAAASDQVTELMLALPSLAEAQRYGDVRQFDASALTHLINGLVVRIGVGLPLACRQIDDEAAAALFEAINKVQAALEILAEPANLATWRGAMAEILSLADANPLLAGRAARLLFETQPPFAALAQEHFHRALAAGEDADRTASWLDSFLRGSGMLLLHDDNLWGLLDRWLLGLPESHFVRVLPMLRRVFGAFGVGERLGLLSRARSLAPTVALAGSLDVVPERASLLLPFLTRILFPEEGGDVST